MRIIRFIKDAEIQLGFQIENNMIVTLKAVAEQLDHSIAESVEALIELKDADRMALNDALNNWQGDTIQMDTVQLLTPIPFPKRNVFCLGKNYLEHAKELKETAPNLTGIPEYPIYFSKTAHPSIGPDENINLHSSITHGEVDYEVELALIIGKEGVDIRKEEAENYIFGYTILNDISARWLQIRHTQWHRGKCLDTHCPMGPVVVTKDELALPLELKITSKINGELRQNGNTNQMIFDIPTIISDLSRGTRLYPGDIIATGTPAGVGMGFKPPKYLKAGDVVECEVEGIGVLKNNVIDV